MGAVAAKFVYTALITDLFSRAIVGWQVADHARADLALNALETAIYARGEGLDGSLVHHSDRAVHYSAFRYTERLDEIGAVRTVDRKGDSYENATADPV